MARKEVEELAAAFETGDGFDRAALLAKGRSLVKVLRRLLALIAKAKLEGARGWARAALSEPTSPLLKHGLHA